MLGRSAQRFLARERGLLARSFSRTRQNWKRNLWKPWVQAKEEDQLPLMDDSTPPNHRPVLKMDLDRVARVNGRRLTAEMLHTFGLRVQDNFCTESQAVRTVDEVETLMAEHGFRLVKPGAQVHAMEENGKIISSSNAGDALRVTGRAEGDSPRAPWGYGKDFQLEAVPDALRGLVEGVLESPFYDVGPVRDITVEKRTKSFFKEEPHTGPERREDGDTVVLLNLLSAVVVTFTPPPDFQHRRRDAVGVALSSWSDDDVDILLRHRSMLLFSGASRHTWQHAVRTGVQVDLKGGQVAICDWWGNTSNLVRRAPHRISIAISFGAKV